MRFAKLLSQALIAAFLTPVVATEEKDTRPPLDRYRGDSQFYLLICGMKLKAATLGASGKDSDFRACIQEGKTTVKASLTQALHTVKKPKAQEALKTYHVAFVTALEGIEPGSDERKISYEQRQQSLSDKVTEAWARFEVEN